MANVAVQLAPPPASEDSSEAVVLTGPDPKTRPLTQEVDAGKLRIASPKNQTLLNSGRVRLRFLGGAGEFELLRSGSRKGNDEAGAYEVTSYELRPQDAHAKASGGKGTLELRQYAEPKILVSSLAYDGPPLAGKDTIEFVFKMDGFRRGMAIHQSRLHWLGPTFASDWRHIPKECRLLLWQRMGAEDFHLLVPLSGEGMMGAVGADDYEMRVSLSSSVDGATPKRIPLFAMAVGANPYGLVRRTMSAAYAAISPYGKLRWQKKYPEVFNKLGWCSWNTYYQEVTEQKVLKSAESLIRRKVPVGFILVDDGWISLNGKMLSDYEADTTKFPNGLKALATKIRKEYGIPNVGVWHASHGHWDGVDPQSRIGRAHPLLTREDEAVSMPHPQTGGSFYDDWYKFLADAGVSFLKVDNQSRNGRFADGLMPRFEAGQLHQRNLQDAAAKNLGQDADAPILNCMAMTPDNAFNWRKSNVARNSEDYIPRDNAWAKEHVHENAYNALWTSNFAYPDYDMFQCDDPRAEYHALARAVSGGPVYFTDPPGKEKPELLRRLALSDGTLLRLDEPGQVTQDMLLCDASMEPVPLKIFGTVTRPGFRAGIVGAFNVNKSAKRVKGTLSPTDVDGFKADQVVVYSKGHPARILARKEQAALELGEYGAELFTLSPLRQGAAVIGLTDKLLPAAGVVSERRAKGTLEVHLREPGELGVYLARAPKRVWVNGQPLSKSGAYRYQDKLLTIPKAGTTVKIAL